MRNLKYLLVILLFFSIAYGDLPTGVKLKLKDVHKNLDSVDKYLKLQGFDKKYKTKHAQSAIVEAEKEWKKIFSWYKGRFDENALEITSTAKRIKHTKDNLQRFKNDKILLQAKPNTPPAKLPKSVKLKLKDIGKKITEMEKISNMRGFDHSYKAKNIKSTLQQAEKEWKRIFSWYGGKFDENHPQIVATKKQLADWKKKLTSLSTVQKVSTVKQITTNSKPLPKSVIYYLKKASQKIKEANKNIANRKKAQASLGSAIDNIRTIRNNYSGKFSEQHPDFTTIINQIRQIQERIENKDVDAQKIREIIPELAKLILPHKANIQKLVNHDLFQLVSC